MYCEKGSIEKCDVLLQDCIIETSHFLLHFLFVCLRKWFWTCQMQITYRN